MFDEEEMDGDEQGYVLMVFFVVILEFFFVRTVSSTATDKNCHVIREQARVMAAADQDSPDSAKTHQVFRPTPGENLFFSLSPLICFVVDFTSCGALSPRAALILTNT
jgi:hypothetical protein